ncbi:hypothetical protein JVU11DRAFT_2527 [Chiua virens]|nr:hypothetical protein JVU11DRAFT_2527 [Chiua virens]
MPPVALIPIHARVRALLRATCNGTFAIAGRSTERDVITTFVASAREPCADEPLKSSLFISGTPGTGKTALANAVLAGLTFCDDLRVITINCMALHNVDDLWDCLHEHMDNATLVKRTKGPKAKGRRLLEKMIVSQQRRCLIVLDELDHIARSPHALSAIFSFARKHASSPSVLTLHFGAYTASQLLEVLQTRLSPLFDADGASAQVKAFLPTGPLTLLSKKVASQTGDVRTLFEVLRGAIDLAVSSSPTSENPLAQPIPPVTPNHILAALKAYLPSTSSHSHSSTSNPTGPSNNSETAVKVRNLGLQSRLVLLAIVLAAQRKDAALPLAAISNAPPKTPTKRSAAAKRRLLQLPQLYTYYATVLERAENGVLTPVSRSEFDDLVGLLETSGIVSSSVASCDDIVAFQVGSPWSRSNDVLWITEQGSRVRSRGAGTTSTNTDPREEEVRAIWIRESRRTTKDMTPTLRDPNILPEAFEC